MAGSLNKVMIIGHVGRDPEMRYTQNGVPTASFSLAANERWKTPEGELHERTEWFNVVTWNKLAETANRYLTKGSRVYIEGRLQTRSWDGQDGQKRYRTEVVAQTMVLLDGKKDDADRADDIEPDEIPF